MTKYKVNEQFDSVQGEGALTGIPSTFIRLQGCPVGCSWCDSGPLADELEGKRRTNGMTANTWGAGGEWKTLAQIMSQVHHRHVIITGGEPTIWDLDPLLSALQSSDHTTQLETAGLKDLHEVAPDWVTWSPKKNLMFDAPPDLKALVNEVKFVVDDELKARDIQRNLDFMASVPRSRLTDVVLMPEGCPPGEKSIAKAMHFLQPKVLEFYGFRARFGDRLQYRLGVR